MYVCGSTYIISVIDDVTAAILIEKSVALTGRDHSFDQILLKFGVRVPARMDSFVVAVQHSASATFSKNDVWKIT